MAIIRQEINIINTLLTLVGSDSARVQLDTAQYSSSAVYYFEIVAQVSTNSVTFNLQRVTGGTNDASIVSTDRTFTRRRVVFTPPAGQTAYLLNLAGLNTDTPNIDIARIIIIDSPTTLTTTETQIEVGGQGATAYTSTAAVAMTAPKYWLYTAANWNGTKTFFAEVTYKTASTNTAKITLQEDNGSFASWLDKVTIVNAVSSTTATRTRSLGFTPTDGRNYRIAVLSSTSKSSVTIYNAKVIVDQSNSPTVFEAQYLLLNTFSSTTGTQKYQTLWKDPNDTTSQEWGGGISLAIRHALEGSGAEIGELDDIDNSNTVVTGSNETITAGQQTITGWLTMPTSGHQIDTNYKTKVTALWGSRILVACTINAPIKINNYLFVDAKTSNAGIMSVGEKIR